MRSRIYGTVERPSVCPSDRLSDQSIDSSNDRQLAGLLLSAGGQDISIDSRRRRSAATALGNVRENVFYVRSDFKNVTFAGLFQMTCQKVVKSR